MFPVQHADLRLKPKDKVSGVAINGQYKTNPLMALRKIETAVEDQICDTQVKVVYDTSAHSAQVHDPESGKVLPSVSAYWFAWATFYHDTLVYGNPTPTPPCRRVVEG